MSTPACLACQTEGAQGRAWTQSSQQPGLVHHSTQNGLHKCWTVTTMNA